MVATLYVYAALFLQSQATSWDLRSMWSSMSALPRIVVGILFVLSVYSFGVMIDRALMTTAFGLLVAVPAVWAYNYFTNKVEAFDVEMDNSSMELINYFILRRGARK